MNEFRFRGLTDQETLDNLEASCIAVEEKEYFVPLTKEEIQQEKENVIQASISIQKLDAEKKEYLESYKINVEPKKRLLNTSLEAIKLEKMLVSGKLYLIPSEEDGEMLLFDSEGRFINSRPMTKDERQHKLFKSA